MDFKTVAGETRKSILLNSAKILVNKVFNTSSNVKIGVVKFSGEIGVFSPIYAASTITTLTDKKEDVLEGLTKLENQSSESGTNIQKGLLKAEEMFSKTIGNKVIVLLTDGCPNEDGKRNHVVNSEMVMTNETYKTVLANTKSELVNIKQKGIKLISLMTGVNSNDVDKDGNPITSTEDDIQAIKTIFGTESNPTAGKFYNVKTTDMSKVIENEITGDIQEILNSPINTVKIVDYFPKDITNHFDFSYVGQASIGTISEKIDAEKGTISWEIGTLKGDEIATIRYRLKIKDMKNPDLLNKAIATNEKVVLTYKDTEAKDYTVILTSSPKIQLSEIKDLTATVSYDPNTETTGKVKATIKTNKKVNQVSGWTLAEDGMTLTKVYSVNTKEKVKLVDMDGLTKEVIVEVTNIKDNTVATGKLPQTGIDMTIVFAILAVILIAIIFYKKYHSYKDVK